MSKEELGLKEAKIGYDSSGVTAVAANGKKSEKEFDGGDEEYDGLTEVIGSFGRFHLVVFSVLGLSVMTHCFQMLENKWLTQKTDFWCARPPGYAHMDPDAWTNLSSPVGDDDKPDKCRQFDFDWSTSSLAQRPPEDTPTKDCEAFEFDRSEFQETAIQRWNLVCSRSLYPRYVQTIFFVGNFVGVLASGPIADTFGRKFCYCLFLTVWIGSAVLGSAVGNFYLWAATRFVCGAMSLGYNNVLSVYITELTTGPWRSKSSYYFTAVGWDVGVVVLGLMAYACRNMQTLELVIGLSNLPFLLCWFFLPESPRWLLSKGKKDKAGRIVGQICRANGRSEEAGAAFVSGFELSAEQQRGNISDLFRTPSIRRNTVFMCLCWLSFSMGYFGLFYNTPTFSLNPFLVFILPAIPVIPFDFVEPYLENKLGRKIMLTWSLLGAGGFLFLTLAFPPEHTGIIVCAWIGTFFCAIAFGAGYTFTKDLYPTTLRSTALGTASASARIGSILSPVFALTSSWHEVTPLILYGATMFTAGLGSVWIWPETKHLRLLYTLEEAEAEASTENEWVAKIRCKKKDS